MQVLINLLGNAIKFTESGYVELKISSVENEKLIFIVTDTGIGITENDQKVIFGIYYSGLFYRIWYVTVCRQNIGSFSAVERQSSSGPY